MQIPADSASELNTRPVRAKASDFIIQYAPAMPLRCDRLVESLERIVVLTDALSHCRRQPHQHLTQRREGRNAAREIQSETLNLRYAPQPIDALGRRRSLTHLAHADAKCGSRQVALDGMPALQLRVY